ncbi:MAG: hypothetical protein AB8B59_11470 [Maribacter sp.]
MDFNGGYLMGMKGSMQPWAYIINSYINPKHNIAIVKSATNNNYGTANDESSFREKESMAMLRTIVNSIKD